MRGWVPASSLVLEAPYSPTHVVVRRFARIGCGGRGALMLPLGSLVAVERLSQGAARIRTPDGSAGYMRSSRLARLRAGRVGPPRPPAPARAKAVLDGLIREVVGTPYLWGGRSTFGFDCSGLVQAAYEFLGIGLPRDSGDQALRGRRLKSLGRLRPLDLIFFGKTDGIDHVAIHLGGLSILHSSGHVRLQSLEPGAPDFRDDLRERFAWATRPLT